MQGAWFEILLACVFEGYNEPHLLTKLFAKIKTHTATQNQVQKVKPFVWNTIPINIIGSPFPNPDSTPFLHFSC